ncbi:response regulator [Synoicihabitans lomoniglobus]|uniref:Response regulator n=1 Tax=Synoicihabitans lomoniglobus TaxID=2909285 RepID=A0AAF0CNN2_9BACT|nr:response regulator [Opitutaceae bacterium LMO-M01]WED65748.1 response regulator [Opitutaceae bacterium LMO-M01]
MTTPTKHILSVDDEEIIREMLGELLEIHGYRVTGVATPSAALKVARNDPPDLVITDLQLEESDGLQLVDQLSKIIPDVPVVLLTGILFDSKTVDQSLSHKISAYLSKTAPLSELTAEIHRLLKNG